MHVVTFQDKQPGPSAAHNQQTAANWHPPPLSSTRRVVLQFRRAYKRNDKPVCSGAVRFLGQLVCQGVAHEVLALELLLLLLEAPSEVRGAGWLRLYRGLGLVRHRTRGQGVVLLARLLV